MSRVAHASKGFLFTSCLLLIALGLISLTQGSGKRKPSRAVQTPNPYIYGQWEPSFTSPSVVGHAAVLPNGKVLHWSPNPTFPTTAPTLSRLWTCVLSGGLCNPDAGLPPSNLQNVYYNISDLFCSGHSFLPDGRLFAAGGNTFGLELDGSNATTIFDANPAPSPSPVASSGPQMAHFRWYPTTVTLGNGETAILSGLDCETTPPLEPCPVNNIPEVLNAAGNTLRTLSTATLELPLYPRMFLASDGSLFYAGPNSPSRWLNTAGTGSWSSTMKPYFCPNDPCITDRSNGAAVMYDVNKVLMAGGGTPPTELAQTIDLTNQTGEWTETESMAFARRHLDLTILADGKVLATGGTSGDGFNNPCPKHIVYEAELWDKDSGANGEWTTMAPMTRRRAYHSFAVLLIDGRVLVGGNTGATATKQCPEGNPPEYQQEIFTPPYLFNSNGTPATRPTISYAPDVVNYNSQFLVLAPNGVSLDKVTMVRLSSVTHSINFNQRINHLTFSHIGSGLRVNTPADANLAPPGHYMLFVINNAGVPSVAKIIKIE